MCFAENEVCTLVFACACVDMNVVSLRLARRIKIFWDTKAPKGPSIDRRKVTYVAMLSTNVSTLLMCAWLGRLCHNQCKSMSRIPVAFIHADYTQNQTHLVDWVSWPQTRRTKNLNLFSIATTTNGAKINNAVVGPTASGFELSRTFIISAMMKIQAVLRKITNGRLLAVKNHPETICFNSAYFFEIYHSR